MHYEMLGDDKKLNRAFKGKSSLAKLSRLIGRKQEGLLQILLSLCKDKTYNRILCCPRFPVRTVTQDLEERLQLFYQSLSGDPYEIPSILASLFDYGTPNDHKKTHGQYFTPTTVANEAVKLLAVKNKDIILDAGCGTGVFPVAILKSMIGRSEGPTDIGCLGVENDPFLALCTAISLDWVEAPENWRVLYQDYLSVNAAYLSKIGFLPSAIISNPPFVRSRKLGERRHLLKSLNLSGYSGLHSFFLAHSSNLLKGDRMVFVLPLEMDETRYGSALLQNLKSSFRIEKKGILYNNKDGTWVVTEQTENHKYIASKHLKTWLVKFESIPAKTKKDHILVETWHRKHATASLRSIADVHRGISTGANSYFVMTDEKVKRLGFPSDFLRRIFPPKIPRNELRDVFRMDDWERLRDQGKPCWLFFVERNLPIDKLPSEVRQYIRMGERRGFNMIPTCRNRREWYSIGHQEVPDLVFTYMSRGNPKFVFNEAHALNLTNFIGIYLKAHSNRSSGDMSALAHMLNVEIKAWIHYELVGRRYAGGLVNIGPGNLAKMPISESILRKLGVNPLDQLS